MPITMGMLSLARASSAIKGSNDGITARTSWAHYWYVGQFRNVGMGNVLLKVCRGRVEKFITT